MKKTILLLLVILFSKLISFAQPLNDNCSGAISLGTLPTPAACPASGVGAKVTKAGTLVGATSESTYPYMTSCTGAGGTTQSNPAYDVWYSFVASGYEAVITVNSTFAHPNIAMYAGSCASLGGGVGGCAVGTGGTVTLTVEQMVIGTTYYLQISGNGTETGTFSLIAQNNIGCSDCMNASTFTATPLPSNGSYLPNQTVHFCYHVDKYAEINTNWLHGVQISLGSGWNASSIVTYPVTTYDCGTWKYYSSGITNAAGQSWSAGFYFDRSCAPLGGGYASDGIPGNNYGDHITVNTAENNNIYTIPSTIWNFCFDVKVASGCAPGSDLSVTINTSGDGESGTWTSLGCINDPGSTIDAVGACCQPSMASTSSSCAGNDGTATATPTGSSGPYTYSWANTTGTVISSTSGVAGANSISGIIPGTYTVSITNVFHCLATNSVVVSDGSIPISAPTAGSNSPICSGVTLNLTAANITGATYSWSGPNGFISSLQNPTIANSTTANSGIYTVTATIGICTNTSSISVTVNANPAPTAGSNTPICVGNALNLTSSPAGAASYHWTGPNGFSSNSQNSSIPVATTAATGNYFITVTLANGCSATATTAVTVNANPATSAGSNTPICAGVALNLTSLPAGAASYNWAGPNSFSGNSQSPTISAATTAATGNYSVTVTLANGCSAAATTAVTVNANPAPTAGSNSPICTGTALNLTSSPAGAASYNWAGPNSFSGNSEDPSIPAATTAATGNYSVTVTLANGCSAAATMAVTVYANLIVTSGSNTPICVGNNLNLTSSPTGAASYNWVGPNGFSGISQNPTISAATTAASGNYSVTVTLANGCSAAATTAITVNANPATSAASNTPMCTGTDMNLTSSPAGAASYNWTGPNGFSDNSQNPSIPTATTAATGNYSVTVTLANGCSAASSTAVTINANPATTAGSNSPVCDGTALTLIASPAGAASYNWVGPNGFSSNSQYPLISAATTAATGNYSVTVTLANGCSATSTTAVTVNANPAPTAGSNSPICTGTTLNLTSSPAGAASYNWAGPNSFSGNSQDPLIPAATTAATGNYSVTVTLANGCSAAVTTAVTVNANPATTVGSNSPVCDGTTLNLSASPAGAASYNWAGPNGFSGNSQSPTISAATTAATGNYSVTVTLANGCSAAAITVVTVNANPATSAGSNTPVCAGTTLNLTSSPAGAATYNWTGPNGFSGNSQNYSILAATTAATGNYFVTITLANGCSAAVITSVIVNANPAATAGSNTPICAGNTLNLTASPMGAASYNWSGPNGFTDNSQNPSIPTTATAASGNYSVTVTLANSCSAVATTAVTVNANPATTAGSNSPVCDGTALTLTASPAGAASYNWAGPNGFSGNSQDPAIPAATTTATGNYFVTVTLANGCSATATTAVTVNANPILTTFKTNENCGQSNGTASVTPSGNCTQNWTYTWSTLPIHQSNQTATHLSAGIYTVTVNCGTCFTITTDTLINIAGPSVSIVSATNTTCGNANGSAIALASFGGGGYSYKWSNYQTGATLLNVEAGTYTVTVTDTNNCTAMNSIILTDTPGPSASISAIIQANCGLSDGSVYIAASGGTKPYTFYWNSTPPDTSQNLTNVPSGNYCVTVSDANGCNYSTCTFVGHKPGPTVTVFSTSDICGKNIGTAIATVSGGIGNYSYSWSNNATTSVIAGLASGTYSISVSDSGCTGSTSFFVDEIHGPVAGFIINPKIVSILDNQINFIDNSLGSIISWNWSLGDGFSESVLGFSHNYMNVGSYPVTLIVTDTNGCINSITDTVKVIDIFAFYIPNAFTPNGDLLNDGFTPQGTNVDPNYFEMEIYDRWGNLMFHTSKWHGNKAEAWNGTRNNSGSLDDIIIDTYIYKIVLSEIDGQEHQYIGRVTIIK